MAYPVYTFDGWRFDTGRRTLRSPGKKDVPLTSGEYGLLDLFCRRAQETLPRHECLLRPAGQETTVAQERAVDVAVTRLRSKIERDPKQPRMIMTVRNHGYYFALPVVVIHHDG